MGKYLCTQEGCTIEIEADSPEEAAREYVEGGSYNEDERKTFYDDVHVEEVIIVDHGRFTVRIDPREPPCTEKDEEHEWARPIAIVRGCDSNPGVFSTIGTGVMIKQVCAKCGIYRIENTGDRRSDTGEWVESLEYRDADEKSLAWVESIREREEED